MVVPARRAQMQVANTAASISSLLLQPGSALQRPSENVCRVDPQTGSPDEKACHPATPNFPLPSPTSLRVLLGSEEESQLDGSWGDIRVTTSFCSGVTSDRMEEDVATSAPETQLFLLHRCPLGHCLKEAGQVPPLSLKK